MKARYALIRTAIPLLIGVGLIAVALWLMGAMPVRSASNAFTVEQSPAVAQAPLQAQSVITIPTMPAGAAVVVDAKCDPASEYAGAIAYNFDDISVTGGPVSGTVYLMHDDANLYICMKGSMGGYPDRFARVYLDTTNDREGYAGPNDFALQIGIVTPTPSSYKGTGVPNGYVAAPISGWSAAAAWGNGDMAEYKIPINVTGGWCGAHFGLAVYHHSVLAASDKYGWPSNQFFDQPQTWQEAVLDGTAPCGSGKIAYVYKRDTATAGDFKGLLEGNGFTVQLVPLNAVTSTNFTLFDLVIIADDTGSLDTWGIGAGQTTTIVSAGKPIVGLGEGGYAFFGQLGLGIGWPHGWHGPLDKVYEDPAPPPTYFHTPYEFAGLLPGPFPLYTAPVNEVGIYLPNNPTVLPIGREPPYPTGALADHAPLIAEKISADLAGCNQLWGYSGGPQQMNLNGGRLFVNAVTYGLLQAKRCTPPPAPTPCVTISKTATPPNGTHVKPGDSISYTVTYTVSGGANCPAVVRAELVDKIPMDTLYVPNSASGGGTLNTGALIWNLGALSAGTYTQTFQVYVLDTQCQDQRRVNNTARLQTNLGVANSNLVTHPVDCPPVTFPNTQPPYAEDDIQIYPYPLVAGHLTKVSARVRNLSPSPQTVTVTFQASSSNVFGIGLDSPDLPVPGNPKVVTLPPSGTVQVEIDWTPTVSGHYCIRVKVEGSGFDPIYTQHNLDVNEDLRPGITDTLSFKVGNPTTTTANILLVVDNTCPGWTVWITPTTLLPAVGPNNTDIRTAYLNVIPPSGPPLGTACHIDVQGWIGGKLIGGIRKLDVPPVQLPPGNPPWEEKEISVIPDPPTPGQTISFCVELQNPLPVSRTVDLVYSYADFGAGIPFTPIQTKTVTLPPYSLDKYCINWPTPTTGTLHKCLLITLKQPGFPDQRSQRNVDFVRPIHGFAGITVTFGIGNPDRFTRTLRINPILIGIDPNLWIPHIIPDPPPDLMPNETRMFTFELVPAVNAMATDVTAASNDSGFGDSNRTEVSVYLDDELLSGFTVDYTPIRLYLPIVMKP